MNFQTRPAGTGKIGKAKTFNKVKDKVSKSKTKQVEAADDATSKATDDAVTFVPARLSTKVSSPYLTYLFRYT